MEVDVRELGGSRVTVHVRLDEKEVARAFDRTYQRLSDRGGIKGFRPGKVPRAILDRYYDRDGIRALTYEDLVEDRLEAVLAEYKLRPLDRISIEQGAPPDQAEALAQAVRAGLSQEPAEGAEEQTAGAAEDHEHGPECDHDDEPPLLLEEGKPFEFHTTFTAYPRPKLPDLSALKLRRPVAEVTDEEVDEQLEQLREINAEEVEVDRDTIEEGDVVVADVKVVLEGENPDKFEARREEIVVGQREYLAGIDRKLIGHAPGDIVEAEFVYQADHPDENLRGKSARVIAEIDSFSGRKLPELTDEFAQSLGGFESFDELRSSIREQLQAEVDEGAQRELRAQVLRFLAEGTQIELPEEMLERVAALSYDQLARDLQQMGMSTEEFAEAIGISDDDLRESQYARARGTLTLHFAFEALAEELGIEVGDEDMMAELTRVAEESGGDVEFVRQAAQLQAEFAEEMLDRAMRRKLIEHLIASAEIEDVPAEQYYAELEQAQARAAESPESEAPAEGVETEVAESPEPKASVESVETEAAADQESEAS